MISNMMKLQSLTLLLAAISLAGCSDKSADRSHRNGEAMQLVESGAQWSFPEATETALTSAKDQEAAIGEKIQAANVELVAAMKPAVGVASVAAAKTKRSELARAIHASIKPLESIALNPNYVGDGVLNQTLNFRQVFRRYTEGLALVVKADPSYAGEKGLLSAFWKVATEGCSEQMMGCRSIQLVQSSSQSSYLLEHYAWELDGKIQELGTDAAAQKTRAELIQRKFTAMKLALKVQNASDDSRDRLSLLYLISSREYQEIPAAKRTSEDDNQHRLIVDRITTQLPRRLKEPTVRTQLAPYIQSRKIWERFTLRDQNGQRQAFGSLNSAVDLMKLTCRYFRDESGFQDAIKDSLNNKDSSGKPGFLREIRDLQSGPNAVILANMKLNMDLQADETLYIVDQVSRGHWDMGIANECWDAITSGQTRQQKAEGEAKLIRVVEKYIQVELIKRIISTNTFMALVFEPKEAGKTPPSSKEIFFRAVDEARGLTDEWERMISRVANMESFVKGTMGEVRKDLQSKQYKDLLMMSRAIRSNIKLLAVYPNMLVLSYYLAAKEFSIDLPTWFGGTFQLDAEMIINWILGEDDEKQAARPLFNFGNDSRAIQTFENLYALFYALKTETFNTFARADKQASGDSDKGISDVNFFSVVTRRYVNKELLGLVNSIKELEEKYNDSDDYRLLQQVCAFEDARQKNKPLPHAYQVSLTMTSIPNATFVAYGNKEVGGALAELYSGTVSSGLQSIRTGIYRKMLFIASMIDVLEDHWNDQLSMVEKLPPAEAELMRKSLTVKSREDAAAKLKVVRGNLKSLQDVIRRYHQFVLQRHREVGNCVYVLNKTENAQQLEIYKREMEFISSVHAALAELNERVAKEPAKKAELEAIYSAAVNGKPEVEAGSYSEAMKKMALLSRAYLEKPGDVDTFDSLTITGGFVYSHWNMMMRMRNMLREINPNLLISTPTVLSEESAYTAANAAENRFNVRYLENGADFLRSVLSTMDGKQFVKWWSKDYGRNLTIFTNRLDTMAELFLAEKSGAFAEAKQACADDKDAPSCKGYTKDMSPVTIREIIDETFRIAGLVNIRPDEEVVLRNISRRAKYSTAALSGLFLNSREEASSLLESPYKAIAGIAKKNLLLEQARDAAMTFNALLSTGDANEDDKEIDWSNRTTRELIFLSDQDSVRKITRQRYRPIVGSTFNPVLEFEKTAECLETKRADANVRYLYELDLQDPTPRSGKWLEPFKRVSGRSGLLEQRLKSDFKNIVDEFGKDTKQVYRARAGDADFGVDSAKDCDALLK